MLLTTLKALWGKVWSYVVLASALAAGLIALRQSGKSAGRADVEREMNQRAAAARKEARHVADTVDSMGDDPVADKLKSDWVRNDKSGG
ncbi:hypothetical protein [Pararhodobacter sp.]|uniref:hypothetical protein n=1 Tax=Pararhodobacter sp. TaxID=2127056 RepID=UPI002AFDD34B|nr:hypothetical protein [Pararhodobacter sp.]